MTVMVC